MPATASTGENEEKQDQHVPDEHNSEEEGQVVFVFNEEHGLTSSFIRPFKS